jgi:siderophore synthetase component
VIFIEQFEDLYERLNQKNQLDENEFLEMVETCINNFENFTRKSLTAQTNLDHHFNPFKRDLKMALEKIPTVKVAQRSKEEFDKMFYGNIELLRCLDEYII